MRRRVLSWLVLLSGLAGCVESPKVDPCLACGADERCDLAAAVCVLNAPPTVSFLSPGEDSFLTAPQVRLLGRLVDDANELVEPRWRVDEGDWRALSLDAEGRFELDLDVPALDGVPLVVAVRVSDRQGLEGVGERRLVIDRVAPLVTVTEPMAGAPTNAASLRFAGTVVDGSSVTLTLDFGDGAGERPVSVVGETFTAEVPTSAADDFVAHVAELRAVDAAGNTSELTWPTIIDRVAPVLSVSSPSEGQIFNASQVDVDGTVPMRASAVDGDTSLTLEVEVALDAWTPLGSDTWPLNTASTDDGVEYEQRVRARDRAGNVALLTRFFRVDRVAPTVVSATPTDGSRGSPREVSMLFSEPVQRTATALPFSFAPAARAGATSTVNASGTVVTVSGLAGGETYRVSPDPVALADLAGNPAAAGTPLTFTTAPRRPTPGTVLIPASVTRQVEWFRAAHDEDGVLSLAVRVVDPTTDVRTWLLGWVDPTTGEWVEQASEPARRTGASLFGHAARSPSGTQHTASANLAASDGPSALWIWGDAGVSLAATIQIGVSPSIAEAGAAPFASVSQFHLDFIYRRPPILYDRQHFGGQIAGVDVYGPEQLTIFGTSTDRLRQWARTCGCDAGVCSCTWLGGTTLLVTPMDRNTSSARVFGDLLQVAQVLRAEDTSYATFETWDDDDPTAPTGKLITGGFVTCLEDGAPSFLSIYDPLAGPARLARGTTPREATVAVWYPPASSSQPGHVFVHEASCPPTPAQLDAGVRIPLTDFARAAGVAATASAPVFAPVLGPTPGLLYVAPPGELRYIE